MNKNVLQDFKYLKFRYCEKATKFEKNIPLYFGLKLLSNVKTK